jgi:hypothetical protein
MSRHVHTGLVCLALLLGLAACERREAQAPTTATPPPATIPAPAPAPAAAPFRVSGVQVGNAIGADKSVVAPTTSLAPGDTIYASVNTEGAAPKVTLTARWTYEDGQLVDESSQTIAPEGPATSEFHISKPDGWPAGRYQVQILADGTAVATQQFEVRAP